MNNEIDIENKNTSENEIENQTNFKERSFIIKDIIQRIGKLQKKEKMHILNIFKSHKIDFTKNSNGYFINCFTVSDNVIQKIHDCLELIEKNSDLIKDNERKRSELISFYKRILEELNVIRKKYSGNILVVTHADAFKQFNVEEKRMDYAKVYNINLDRLEGGYKQKYMKYKIKYIIN